MTTIYRVVVRGHFDELDDSEAAALDADVERAARDRATEWLTTQGYGHKHLTVSVTDMASMWR